MEQLQPFTTAVGVFVHDPLSKVQQISRYCRLSAVQLQGDDSNDNCQSLPVPAIKGFHIGNTLDVDAINAYQVAANLLDTHVPGLRGGAGKAFGWGLLRNRYFARPLIVAGGLHAGNVEQLLRLCTPSSVDTSSSVALSARHQDS
ncbi:phosphoribosylanthranilate isomerase [Serratia marcescens]|nr:phosphoribosylanthranilate isomerase [Serratia marcescens]MBH2865777.1 phosphoribosylanthranilate isomerase [Serratia marcescens]MBW4239711.1 phosphoribosylanthranilate isomerase [Enterobacter roggenkampii]